MDYYVEDTINVLENVKHNPYGIKDSGHALDRAQKRGVDLNVVNGYLCDGFLVGIEKSLNESTVFQLLYEHSRNDDLCIVINILNEEEIEIITLIEKILIRGDIMHIEEFDAEYTYDYHLDVVNIEVKKDYVHAKSIDLAFGVFLDFDDNCLPVNLEIVSASKILGIEKDCLKSPNGNVTIIIGDNIIDVKVKFEFKNEDESIQLNALNDFGFPNSQTSFALV